MVWLEKRSHRSCLNDPRLISIGGSILICFSYFQLDPFQYRNYPNKKLKRQIIAASIK